MIHCKCGNHVAVCKYPGLPWGSCSYSQSGPYRWKLCAQCRCPKASRCRCRCERGFGNLKPHLHVWHKYHSYRGFSGLSKLPLKSFYSVPHDISENQGQVRQDFVSYGSRKSDPLSASETTASEDTTASQTTEFTTEFGETTTPKTTTNQSETPAVPFRKFASGRKKLLNSWYSSPSKQNAVSRVALTKAVEFKKGRQTVLQPGLFGPSRINVLSQRSSEI